jgi:GNAT superfamily N-acetyltransferase
MSYAFHRYPADLIDVLELAGERVVIRPVLPQDQDLTAVFFANLSPLARQQRFLSAMRSLPPGLLARLTQVDYTSHLALVAEVFRDGRESVIAEARYAVNPDRSEAEFAVSVAEPWQGLGLARRLLETLARRAAKAGIRRLVGETLDSNERMLKLAKTAGFSITRSLDTRGLMRLQKTLAPALTALPPAAARPKAGPHLHPLA